MYSIEYMVHYSFIAIAAVIALWALTSMGARSARTFEDKECTGFRNLSYIDHKLNANDTFYLRINNDVNTAITVMYINTTIGDKFTSKYFGRTMLDDTNATFSIDNVAGAEMEDMQWATVYVDITYEVVGIPGYSKENLACHGNVE